MEAMTLNHQQICPGGVNDRRLCFQACRRKGKNEMTETEIRNRLSEHGHGYLFNYWDARSPRMKRRLIEDLETIDLAMLDELRTHIGQAKEAAAGSALEPAPYIPRVQSAADRSAREIGEDLIRGGKTAVLTVAGGQGSRLGFNLPKGMFPVSPIRKLTLFAVHAEKLLAARRWFGVEIPWLIMTSPSNRAVTEEYFRKQVWFGLGSTSVHFFTQGTLPSFSPGGELLMAPDGGLLFNPDGHGGLIAALHSSGMLQELHAQGIEELFYFQVDNPIARVPDAQFLGFHRRAGSEISSKVVPKAYPEENLGVIATMGGAPYVIEYSDLDDRLKQARDREGKLLFSQASIAIHLLNVNFLSQSGLSLPYHLAQKKVLALVPGAKSTEILSKDAIKVEKFIFDAIPIARTAIFFETDRIEEFAPIKNREGVDSITTCIRGQIEKAARWLSACGVEVPRDSEGKSLHTIEISSLFALDQEALAAKRGSLKDSIDEDTLLA